MKRTKYKSHVIKGYDKQCRKGLKYVAKSLRKNNNVRLTKFVLENTRYICVELFHNARIKPEIVYSSIEPTSCGDKLGELHFEFETKDVLDLKTCEYRYSVQVSITNNGFCIFYIQEYYDGVSDETTFYSNERKFRTVEAMIGYLLGMFGYH